MFINKSDNRHIGLGSPATVQSGPDILQLPPVHSVGVEQIFDDTSESDREEISNTMHT